MKQTVTKRYLRISIKLEMPDICQIYGGTFNKKNGHPLFVLTSRNAPSYIPYTILQFKYN